MLAIAAESVVRGHMTVLGFAAGEEVEESDGGGDRIDAAVTAGRAAGMAQARRAASIYWMKWTSSMVRCAVDA